MTNQFFRDHIVSEQQAKGAFNSYLNTFIPVLAELGYSSATIKTQRYLLKSFIRWVESNQIAAASIGEDITDRFLIESERKGAIRRGDSKTLHRFLDHLRTEGVIPHPKPTLNNSPLAHLQSWYEEYLQNERGLSVVTGSRYWPYIRRFIIEKFGTSSMCFRDLCSQDIDRFLLRHLHKKTPKADKLMVSALRSFLRFLFRYGETGSDLSTAVPTIAAWRLSEVPKHIKPEDVESLLGSCDQNTSVGRRNYAILLLIARLGLRSGEIVALELNDINWRSAELTVCGKGRFCDRLPLPQSVGEALAVYLKNDRPKCSTRKVFVRVRAPYRSLKGASTVSTIVRRTVENCGLSLPNKGAHMLRHSLATNMLRQGASMTEIGELLRHRSINSTEIYAKVDLKGLDSIVRIWPEKGGVT